MAKDKEIGISRHKFEAFLKGYSLEGYRYYVQIKKQAIAKGEDPIKEFRLDIEQNKGGKAAARFWLMALAKRLVDSNEQDVAFLRDALAEHHIDLEEMVEILGGDRKKIADIICALNLKKLEDAGVDSLYMIVDRVVNAKGTNSTPPTPDRFFLDDIPEDLISEDPNAFELLKQYGIEELQRSYQISFEDAQEKMDERIAACSSANKRKLLIEIKEYYLALRELKIPGIVSEIIDPETGETVHFPAIHQKIGARFIRNKKRTLIADEMGIGKTATAIIAKNLIDEKEGKRTTAVMVVPGSVLRQWEAQIKLWNVDERSTVIVTAKNKEQAIAEIEEKRPDFVLVTYDMIFRKHNGGTVGDKLAKVVDYLVLDEVHNAKEAKSLRSQQIMELSHGAEYVTMLSGTPVPNRVSDLGVVASILWDHKFTPREFNRAYQKNPRIVRQKLLPRMLRRRKRETFGESRCTVHEVPIPMSEAQEKRHEHLDLNPDKKSTFGLMADLRRCALDPRLAGVDEPSPKYEKLIELLIEHDDGTAPVVFTTLKTGVLDRLCDRLSEEGFRVARVDGDPSRTGRKRDEILKDFTNDKYDIIIATLETLGEGVNQLAVSRRAYFLEIPFTDARLAQGITRLDRKGQKSDEVDIYLLISENSIDETILRLIKQKKILGEFLVDGMELTDEEKEIIDSGEKVVDTGTDPLRKLYRFFGTTTNRESEKVIKLLQDPVIGEFIAKHYWEDFDGSFYGNTMNLIVNVIKGLEKGGRRFDEAIDIASGPCCLARAWRRPVVSLDANPIALQLGKKMLGDQAGETIEASFTDMPVENGRFDLAVFSLGILHSTPEEREGILREVNRSMKKNGVLVITTPSGNGRYERLSKILPMLGFKVLPEITGTAQGVDKVEFECMIISAVKISEPVVDSVPVELFDFNRDSVEAESFEASVSKKIKRKECTKFEIDSMAVEDAGIESAKTLPVEPAKKTAEQTKEEEIRVARTKIRRMKTEQERLTFVYDRFSTEIRKGGIRGIPKEALDGLGLELVEIKKGRQSALTLTLKEDIEAMKEGHKEFVNGHKPKAKSKKKGRVIR
ncbi:MAG: SNF2-related protein [Candidatus Micrarchaeota archaeon]